jgi:alpha-glucosidase (family GH31 glycosyl hydrolase)
MMLGTQAQFNAWERGDVPWHCTGAFWDVFVRHYDLRMSLGPYLYTAARKQSLTGLPILRPLLLQYPAERNTRHIDDEFMLGPDLLVAPANVDGKTNFSRFVYFPGPTGTIWYNWWSPMVTTAVAGPARINVSTPVDFAPIFVRGGAVLPTATQSPGGGITLIVALSQAESGKDYCRNLNRIQSCFPALQTQLARVLCCSHMCVCAAT